MKYNILIIDDDAEVRSMIADILEDEDYIVRQAENWAEALERIKEKMPTLVFLDLWLGADENAGIRLLEKIKSLNSYIPVVMISGHGSIDVAVTAIKKGAYDFIEKPFVIERLLLTAKRAIESNELLKENIRLKTGRIVYDVAFIGKSGFVSRLNNKVAKVAPTNTRVAILGPKGSFPEAVAYSIHAQSNRSKMPFIEIDCELNNSKEVKEKLFGAYGKRPALANAHGGTLFIKGFLMLSKECQELLLTFLQTGMLNGTKIDTRIIVSTTDTEYCDPNYLSSFSRDLFLRLSICSIEIAPLSKRLVDIPDIIDFYIDNAEKIFKLPKKELSKDARARLESYYWPGDLAQLRNVLEFAMICSQGEYIEIEDLPENAFNDEGSFCANGEMDRNKFLALPLKEAREAFEREYLKYHIWRLKNNISKVAEFVDMDRSALYKKFRALHMNIVKNGDEE